MRSRLTRRAPPLVLAAATVVAAATAQQFTRAWLRVAPEGEVFAVHMPEPNFRIRRELPFPGRVTLKPASFEVTYRGGLFSVLSFLKSEPKTPATLSAFADGFRHALVNAGVNVARQVGQKTTLDGRDGVEFGLNVDDKVGKARVFETDTHFYVVLTLGGPEAESAVEHFQNSFTLDREGADRVAPNDVAERLTRPAKSPPVLWPVAGGMTLVVGTGDGEAPANRVPGFEPSKSPGRKIISGGVLNGEAISKPQPAYPPIAKAARAQGTVTVQVLIDEEGYVISASAVSGHPLLQQAAVLAARQARFTPTFLEGQPVKVSGVITYNFVLM